MDFATDKTLLMTRSLLNKIIMEDFENALTCCERLKREIEERIVREDELRILKDINDGSRGKIRTSNLQDQNLLAYHLPTLE